MTQKYQQLDAKGISDVESTSRNHAKEKTSMREALAKVWGFDEGKILLKKKKMSKLKKK